MTFVCLLLAAPMLIPQTAPIGEAGLRVKDPARDPLPADPVAARLIRRGYQLFLHTPRDAPQSAAAALSCGNCHLNAGQREGALPLLGIAAIFPEYNKRAGRNFTLEDRVVG